MNWKQHLFKPKWQSKDAGIRRQAVAEMSDPALFEALPSICLEDEDPGVRAAATRRVSDLAVLSGALDSEQDAECRLVLSARITQLVTATGPDRLPLESRLAVILDTDNRELVEQTAAQAPEPELRRAALKKVTRQGFLGDRAVEDPDPELRRVAAAAVTQHSTLRRIIDLTRKSDKALHQSLSERLHDELLESGDARAIREEAISLCAELEAFALRHQQDHAGIPGDIARRWIRIEHGVDKDLTERYRHIVTRMKTIQGRAGEPVPESSGQPPEAATVADDPSGQAREERSDADTTAVHDSPLLPLLNELKAVLSGPGKVPGARVIDRLGEKWRAAVDGLPSPDANARKMDQEARSLIDAAREAAEKAAQKAEAMLEQADTLLIQIKSELENGALHKALETRHKLIELGKSFGKGGRWKAVSRELAGLQGRIRELRDWQHWSNDKIRKELIREMEVLPATDLHPDAILDRVKSLQARWKELEQSEQIPGDKHYHAKPWMWRKFSAAGHKAFEATKPFLEKRDEIRDRHLESIEGICKDIETATGHETPDFNTVNQLLQKARQELRELDKLPHKARKKAAGRLRKALDKGKAATQVHYEAIEKQKLKLIRAASQLAHLDDMDEAISRAKGLQAEWKAAGRLWRSRDNELWAAFREPLDPLFGKLKADQDSHREAIQERLKAQKDLCASMEEILTGEDGGLEEFQGKVQGLRDAWRDIEHPDRRLQSRFQEHSDRFDQRVRGYRRQQADRVRSQWWDKSRLLHELESGLLGGELDDKGIEKLEAKWPPGESAEPIDEMLDQRFRGVLEQRSVGEIDPGTAKKARDLCIQLEFLAGLPSPAKDKDLRMKYQVDRLSLSLSGEGERLSAVEEARRVEQEWLTLPVLKPADQRRFEKRIQRALGEINENNKQ
jgi:hypothetical protein